MSVTKLAPGASRFGPLLAAIILSYVGVQAFLARNPSGDVAAQGIVAITVLCACATAAAVVSRRAVPIRWRSFAFAVALLAGIAALWVVGFATECLVTERCFR